MYLTIIMVWIDTLFNYIKIKKTKMDSLQTKSKIIRVDYPFHLFGCGSDACAD